MSDRKPAKVHHGDITVPDVSGTSWLRKPNDSLHIAYQFDGRDPPWLENFIVVRVGDCVHWMLVSGKPPSVARVEKIEADARNNVKVHCRWYYLPPRKMYCKCEMPYNPNDLIVHCEGCGF
ncbi:PREDICTED: chromatin remodeling protein EBS-like [Camelina sativa]|uniref:Chromatin remodeling protein EBS-like n=1 Tax=Camelina sativa TaxID=90675 RepID=A0ABM0T811_CAMSA|nr:PREDICTED: chromatin remodeling protein EBS-like [Camelina sativa]